MAINGTQTVFRYKTAKGPLHKLPVMLKLFLLLPLSVFCMSLPPLGLAAGIITAAITAFLCGFTLREQLADMKPAFLYAALMYALSVFSNLLENWGTLPAYSLAAGILLPRDDFLRIALRLALIVQLSALLFRSTSSIEIREGLNTTERFIRRIFSRLPLLGKQISIRPRFAQNITLFLCFIPEIFSIWASVNLAWKARGGKQGMARIKTLIFVLISLSFEKAALKTKALEARGE
ncbi:MAG: energy-coupling factor transporter transmembrane protein EcfT [Treponema sp.]|nr:energy-coupling factor transporter transmembrane protein EcfT [Treponema sp.]